MAAEVVKAPFVSTANRSTSRLGRLARVGLSSTTGELVDLRSNEPVGAEEPVTQLGRALVDLHGSKSLPAFARDVYYIGRNYEVTGPKGRLSWRRRRRHRRRRIVQVVAGKVPSPAHWPLLYCR